MSVELTIENGLAFIRLNRPEALNALSFTILSEIDSCVVRIEQAISQGQVRGLIITGAGDKAFCAGADITELTGRSMSHEHEGARIGQAVFTRISNLKVVSVAVIQGYAFGGGLEMALACTFRVALPRAKMGLPEVKLGLIPGYGGTQRLPRLIGEGRALDIILSGRTVDAQEAERIGLVNKLIDDGNPVDVGKDFLAPYLKHGLAAVDFARQAILRGMETTLSEGLRIERDLSTLAYRTEDAAEGMKAFVEKRPAQFKDR